MNLHKVAGEIRNLHITSTKQNIVSSPQQREAAGLSAMIFAAAGMAGAAVQTSMNADAAADDVDLYSFEIDGKRFAGCTRKATFRNGDRVEIVFDSKAAGQEVLGIRRPSDRSIWLYPYMSKGSGAAIQHGIRIWLWSSIGLFLGGASLLALSSLLTDYGFDAEAFIFFVPVMAATSFGILALVIALLAPRYLRLSRAADEVFAAFGFDRPKQVDLAKTSTANRKKQGIPLTWDNKTELWY